MGLERIENTGGIPLSTVRTSGPTFYEIVNDVVAERARQDEKFPNQHLSPYGWYAILMEEIGEVANAMIEGGRGSDVGNYDVELVQCAAVIFRMLEDWREGSRGTLGELGLPR